MAYGVYFPVQGMSPEKYHSVHSALQAAGQAAPQGRSFHAGFHVGDGIQVFDVWETMEDFEAFGGTLMPILAEHGIDPGEPQISEIELLIEA
jgi:hypothetical protein